MALFSRHVDARLGALAAGELGPWATRRVLAHARGCPRCGALVDRALLAQRVLEGSLFKPSEAEAALWDSSAARIAQACSERPQSIAPRWAFGFAGAVAACALLVLAWPRPAPEFAARGDGVSQDASLRVYCAKPDGSLDELTGPTPCPPKSALGFAVGVRSPGVARLVVLREGQVLAQAEFPVQSAIGAEEAVDVSVPVGAAGILKVEARFAKTAPELDSTDVKLAREVVVR